MTVDPIRLLADGRATASVIVHVSKNGQPVPNATVQLRSSGQGDRLSISEGTSDDDGVVVASLSSTAGGASTVTAIAGDELARLDVVFDSVAATCVGTMQLPFRPALALPRPIRAIDVDGDGDLDLEGGGLDGYAGEPHAVALNRGDGSFDDVVTIPMGVLRDVNHDNLADVVSVAGNELHVNLGNGDGTFGSTIVSSVGAAVGSLTVGDFDDDGNPDVAFAAGNVVLTANGTGDGHFDAATPSTISLASPVIKVLLAADLDEDGRSDLLAVSSNSVDETTVHVALANADGTFQTPSTIALVSLPIIMVEDVDGDGHADIAATEGLGELQIRRGRGDGTFNPAFAVSFDLRFISMASADVDHDGVRDLIVAPNSGASYRFARGNGDGSFSTPAIVQGGERTGNAVAAADLDGNGRDDLVSQEGSGAVVLLDNGSGFGPSTTALDISVAGIDAYGVSDQLVIDIDHDGHPDVVASMIGFLETGEKNVVATFRGRGDGTFEPGVVIREGLDEPKLLFGDLDRDGDPDLVVGTRLAVDLYSNTDGTFAPTSRIDLDPYSSGLLVLADLDGDGKLDLSTTTQLGLSAESPFDARGTPALSVLKGDGHGGFSPATTTSLGLESCSASALARFDHDGVELAMLLVCSVGQPRTVFLIGQSDGTFDTRVVESSGTFEVVADFDGDGLTDLLTRTASGVEVRLGTLTGEFDAPISSSFDLLGFGTLSVADLDRDGHLDVIGIGSVMRGDGTGAFTSTSYPFMTGIGDVDHDGALDAMYVTRVGLQTCAP